MSLFEDRLFASGIYPFLAIVIPVQMHVPDRVAVSALSTLPLFQQPLTTFPVSGDGCGEQLPGHQHGDVGPAAKLFCLDALKPVASTSWVEVHKYSYSLRPRVLELSFLHTGVPLSKKLQIPRPRFPSDPHTTFHPSRIAHLTSPTQWLRRRHPQTSSRFGATPTKMPSQTKTLARYVGRSLRSAGLSSRVNRSPSFF